MYCTLNDARRELKLTDAETRDDAHLLALIEGVQALIETRTGKVFEAAAPTDLTFDALRDVCGLELNFNRDCAEIVSITNGDGATVSASAYVTEPRQRQAPYAPIRAVRLKASASVVWTYADDPEDAITINGYWAYSKQAPADIRRAAAIAVAHLYRAGGTNSDNDRPLVADGVVIEPGRLPASFWAVVNSPNYQAFT